VMQNKALIRYNKIVLITMWFCVNEIYFSVICADGDFLKVHSSEEHHDLHKAEMMRQIVQVYPERESHACL